MKKLSYRDRIIVLIILVFMIIFSGVFLLIKPKFDDISTAKTELEQAEAKWSEAQGIISQISTVKKRLDTKYSEAVELSERFVDEKNAYTLDQFMKDYFDRNGIYVRNIKTSEASVSTLSPYSTSKEEIDYTLKSAADLTSTDGQTAEENASDGAESAAGLNESTGESLGSGTVNVEFTTTKDQLLALMQEIKDSGKTIEINSIDQLSEIYTNPLSISTSMQITVYYAVPVSSLEEEAEETTESVAE